MSHDTPDDRAAAAGNGGPKGDTPNDTPLNGNAGGSGPKRPVPIPTPSEVIAWARQHFSEEEVLADLREVQETGGLQLSDFIEELERAAGSDE